MDQYALWAIALGGLLLLFEAYKEYSNNDSVDKLKSNNQPNRAELKNVRMTALTTKSENQRGRAIYMLLFLLIYLLFLVFPELIPPSFYGGGTEADAASGGASHSVKSIINPAGQPGDSSPLDDPGSMPIWLAMAIVLGATSPTFQIVESQVRSVAYFFAGVPRNIFRVLDALEGLKYENYASTAQLPLLSAYSTKTATITDGSILAAGVQNTKSALRCIDLLQRPIIGPQRSAFRDLFNEDAPLARMEDLRARYSLIRTRIQDLDPDAADLDVALMEIETEAVSLTESMQCLFALFAIRSRKLPEALANTPTGAIIRKVTEDATDQSQHDITLASLFGAIFSYLAVDKLAMMLHGAGTGTDISRVRDVTDGMLIPLVPTLVILAIVTIVLRRTRIDQGNWASSGQFDIPFFDYARLALVPSLVAVAVYVIIMALQADVVQDRLLSLDFDGMVDEGKGFLGEEYNQLPRVFLMCFFASCALLFIADQHGNLQWYATVSGALVASLFLWMVATVAGRLCNITAPSNGLTPEDMSVLVTVPYAVFLILYASASELTERLPVKRVISAAHWMPKHSQDKEP